MTSREIFYFLQSLRALSCYHQALGINYYPVGAKLSILDNAPGPGEHTNNVNPANKADQTPPKPLDPAKRAPHREQSQPADAAKAMGMVSLDLQNCRLCAASEIQPLTAQAGRLGNGGDPASPPCRLLVVGDYYHGADFNDASIFGKEEDELLAKMLAAIGLVDADVAITNLIKCRPAVNTKPSDAVAECCLAHLRHQVLLVQPRLILAMGSLPARILLAKNASSLSALRGRLHNFSPQEGQPPTPVLVSYHPAFLLTQTEMKKAAWEDLKIAQRFLASLPLAASAAKF